MGCERSATCLARLHAPGNYKLNRVTVVVGLGHGPGQNGRTRNNLPNGLAGHGAHQIRGNDGPTASRVFWNSVSASEFCRYFFWRSMCVGTRCFVAQGSPLYFCRVEVWWCTICTRYFIYPPDSNPALSSLFALFLWYHQSELLHPGMPYFVSTFLRFQQ